MTGLVEGRRRLASGSQDQTAEKKVHLNKLGLNRVNEHRKKKGLSALDYEALPIGLEIETTIGEEAPQNSSRQQVTTDIPEGSLPAYVYNSTLKYFPPIRTQGSLPSCGSFSGTYYTMTYMYALAKGLDSKNGGDSNRLSPKWTYNMVNDGALNGSWYYWCFDIGIKHGCSTWAEFPYDGNYLQWCLNSTVWKNSIYRHFDQYGYIANTDQDTGIQRVKQCSSMGTFNIPTYINSWQYKTISNDPATTDDDAFCPGRIIVTLIGQQVTMQ